MSVRTKTIPSWDDITEKDHSRAAQTDFPTSCREYLKHAHVKKWDKLSQLFPYASQATSAQVERKLKISPT